MAITDRDLSKCAKNLRRVMELLALRPTTDGAHLAVLGKAIDVVENYKLVKRRPRGPIVLGGNGDFRKRVAAERQAIDRIKEQFFCAALDANPYVVKH